ncbi:MAG: hypothetical protein J6B17_01535 [Ruminococcus sp.]|nr:hypothetical protein [Ruminococcus sp.]
MKKRLMSILISAMMILTSLAPIAASAEETVNIFETYTFEEFLALSEEEICAISEEAAEAYRSYGEQSTGNYGYVLFNVWTNESITRLDGENMMLPEDIFDHFVVHSNGFHADDLTVKYNIFAVDFDERDELANYSDYNEKHLKSVIRTWITLNPIVSFCFLEEPCWGVTPGDADQNGLIDTSDATDILAHYANTASGISTASFSEAQLVAADIDRNRVVDIDDATAVLTYYAQKAAGLSPVWDDILAS